MSVVTARSDISKLAYRLKAEGMTIGSSLVLSSLLYLGNRFVPGRHLPWSFDVVDIASIVVAYGVSTWLFEHGGLQLFWPSVVRPGTRGRERSQSVIWSQDAEFERTLASRLTSLQQAKSSLQQLRHAVEFKRPEAPGLYLIDVNSLAAIAAASC